MWIQKANMRDHCGDENVSSLYQCHYQHYCTIVLQDAATGGNWMKGTRGPLFMHRNVQVSQNKKCK